MFLRRSDWQVFLGMLIGANLWGWLADVKGISRTIPTPFATGLSLGLALVVHHESD